MKKYILINKPQSKMWLECIFPVCLNVLMNDDNDLNITNMNYNTLQIYCTTHWIIQWKTVAGTAVWQISRQGVVLDATTRGAPTTHEPSLCECGSLQLLSHHTHTHTLQLCICIKAYDRPTTAAALIFSLSPSSTNSQRTSLIEGREYQNVVYTVCCWGHLQHCFKVVVF